MLQDVAFKDENPFYVLLEKDHSHLQQYCHREKRQIYRNVQQRDRQTTNKQGEKSHSRALPGGGVEVAAGAVGVKEEERHVRSAIHEKGTGAWTWPHLEAQSDKMGITERQESGNRR